MQQRDTVPTKTGTQKPDWLEWVKPIQTKTAETKAKELVIIKEIIMITQSQSFFRNLRCWRAILLSYKYDCPQSGARLYRQVEFWCEAINN